MTIDEQCIVERVQGDYVWLKPLSSNSACGSCKSSGSCSTSTVSKLFSPDQISSLKIKTNKIVKVGDEVILGINSQAYLKTIALLYLLPLLLLFLLASLGFFLGGEIVSIILGGIGLFIGFVVNRRFFSTKTLDLVLL